MPKIQANTGKKMNYVLEVVDSIFLKSGRESTLAPEIYTIIAEWKKKEIPLTVVIASIEEIWDEEDRPDGKFELIDILKATVNKNFRSWLSIQ